MGPNFLYFHKFVLILVLVATAASVPANHTLSSSDPTHFPSDDQDLNLSYFSDYFSYLGAPSAQFLESEMDFDSDDEDYSDFFGPLVVGRENYNADLGEEMAVNFEGAAEAG